MYKKYKRNIPLYDFIYRLYRQRNFSDFVIYFKVENISVDLRNKTYSPFPYFF